MARQTAQCFHTASQKNCSDQSKVTAAIVTELGKAHGVFHLQDTSQISDPHMPCV